MMRRKFAFQTNPTSLFQRGLLSPVSRASQLRGVGANAAAASSASSQGATAAADSPPPPPPPPVSTHPLLNAAAAGSKR